MKILGISGLFHDSAACLLVDGDILSFAEEERFDRRKHSNAYPRQAIDWVLADNGCTLDDMDEVVYYMDPWDYFRTGLRAALANLPFSLRLMSPAAATMPPLHRLRRLATLKHELKRAHAARGDFKLVYLDHYRTHQGAAFYASGFDEAAIVTMDFAVDGTTEVIAHGRGTAITDLVKHRVPNGLAMVYMSLTHMLGFRAYDEFKVMGMAAYGEPRYLDRIRRLYRLDPETGALALDLDYFEFHKYGMKKLFSDKLEELFWPPRGPDDGIGQREYDLAASLQAATNEYGIVMAGVARRLTGADSLCMAGGVAQNCLMNQAICESGLFENVFLQPLAGDVGCPMGAALYRYHQVHGRPRRYALKHLYLGPEYSARSAEVARAAGLRERPSNDWQGEVAHAIADGLVVGYFGGRMEAGPRALGSRSIMADARRADMKDILNARVKHREHFRPFAPSVLAERVEQVFEPLPACRSLDFMIVTMTVRPDWRAKVPAITHGDDTARVQTVRKDYAPDYHEIIRRYDELTGVPLVLNTSFNDNEPIVCTPEHAIACFRRTRIDLLAMDGRLYYRADNADAVDPEPGAQ